MHAAILLSLLAATPPGPVFPGGGGGMCALDGSVSALAPTYRATTTTSTGYQCDATLSSCIDLGPGSYNFIGTNVAGDIVLGPQSGNNATVRIYGSIYVSNITQSSGVFDAYNNGYLGNTFPGRGLAVNDGEGLQIVGNTSLAVCSSTIRNTLKSLTFAAASGTVDRLCWCRSDNAASPVYRWVNVVSGSVGATDTECPL